MKTAIPFYMHPATARALLTESRYRVAKRRVERELVTALRQQGWSDSAAGELAAIHAERRGVSA